VFYLFGVTDADFILPTHAVNTFTENPLALAMPKANFAKSGLNRIKKIYGLPLCAKFSRIMRENHASRENF
jgi:hypothetical protein